MSEGDPSSNAVVPPTGERKRESVNVACQTDQVTRKGESLFNFANVQGGSSSGAAEVDDDPSGVKPNSVEKYFMAKKTGGDLSADDKKRCSTQTQSTSQKIGEPDWNDESCRLKLTIPKFSELEETMCSEGKSIQNVQWKIMVMPKQHMVQKKTQKCMGFFLQCAPENTYSDNWEVHAVADMRLLSCKAEVNHFSRRTTHTYTSKENDWGYSCFMTWADILDESQGYIKNDTVQLEIAVKSNEAKHIMKYEQFVQKIERWMQLADMQLAKGQIDLAIEANSNAINFCKDKDDKCLERLEAQKSRIVQEKLIQSISRIEKGHEVDAQPVKPQSLRLVLSGAQKSSNGKMAGKGAKKGRPVMTVKQLQKKKEQKAEIVEKQKTQIQQQHDRVREAQKKQLRTSIDAMEQQQRLFKQDSHADTERELEKVTMELRRLKDQQKSLTEAVAADGVLDDGQDNESNRTYNVDSSSGNSVCDLSQMQLSSINSDEDDYESTEAYNEGEFGGDDDVTLSDLYYNNQVPVQSQQDESQLNGLDTNNLEQNLYAMKIDDETGEASSTPAANDPRTLMVAALSTAARMTVERMPQTTGGDINEQGDIDLRDYDPDHLIQDSVDTIMNSSMFDDEVSDEPPLRRRRCYQQSWAYIDVKFSPSDRLLSGKNEEDIEIHDKSIQTEGEESRAAMKELIKLRQRRPAGVKDTMENLQHLQQLQHEISQQLADSYHPYTFIPTQVATQPANDIRGFELPMSRVLPAGYLNSIIMDDGYVYKDNVIPLGSEGESVLYQTPMYRLLCGDEEVYDALESYLSDCKRGEDQFERIFDPNGDEKRQCGEHLIAMCNSNFSLLNLTEEQKDSVVNDLQKNIRTHAMFHRLLVTLAASVVMSTQIRTFRAVTTINAYADVLQLVTNDWKNLIDSLTRMMQETQNAANGIGEKIEKGRHLGELKALRNQLEGEKSYHNLMLKFNSCKDALNGLPPPNNKIHNKMLTAMQRRHAWYPQSIETKNMRVMLEQVDKILSNSVVVSDQADQVCEELVKLATLLDNALGVADFTDYLIHQEERKLELVDHLEVYRDKAEKEGAVLTKMRVESESLKAELTIIQDRYTKVDRELKTTNGTLKETRTNLKKAETKASKEEVRANNIQSSLNDSENRVKSLKKDIEILKKSSADEKNKAKKEKEKDQALIRQQSVDLAAREHERDKAKKELQDTIRAKEKIEKERKSLASQLATQTDRAKAAEVMILETRKKAARADLEEKLEEAKSGMAETNELLKRFRTVNDQETLNKSLSEWTTAVDKYSSFVKTVGYEYEGHINEIRTGAKTLAQIPEVKIPQYDLPKLFRPPPVQKVAPSSQASAPTPQPAAVATPPPPPPMIPQPAAGVIGQPRAMHAGRFGAPGAPSTTPVTSARRCAGSPTTGNAPSSTPTTSTPLKKSGTSTTNGVPTNETNGTSSSSSATPGGLASLTGGLWPWTSYDMFHPIASESSDSQFNSSLNSFHRNIWAANSESSFMSDLFGTSAERSASSPSAATPPAATPTAAAPAPPPPPPPSAPSTPSAGTFLSALAAQHQQFNPAPGQPVGRPQNQQQQQDQPSMIGSMTSSQQQHQQVQQQQQQQQHQQHHRLLQQQQQQQQQHVAHHMQQQQSSSSGPPPGHHHLQQHQPRYGDLWALQQPPHSQQQQNQVHNTLSGLNLPNPIQPPNNHTHQTQQQQQQTLFQQMQLRQNSMNNASGDHARDNFANFQGGWKPQQSPHMSQQPRSNGYNHYNNNYD